MWVCLWLSVLFRGVSVLCQYHTLLMTMALQDSLKSGPVIPPAAGRWNWVALQSACSLGVPGASAGPRWGRLSPMHLAAWCEGSQNGASGLLGGRATRHGRARRRSTKCCLLALCPCGRTRSLLSLCVSPRGIPVVPYLSRSASGYTPGFFQIATFLMIPELWDFMCALQNQTLISYDSLALPYTKPHSCLQNQTFLGLVFPLWESQSGEPDVGLQPLTLWG